MLARDKQPSLLNLFVSGKEKIIMLTIGVIVIVFTTTYQE